MMAPVQTTYRKSATPQVTVHTTTEANPLSTKTQSTSSFTVEPTRTAIQPLAVETEQNLPDKRDQMEMDTDEEAVQPQQANQRGTMDSPIIIQESQPLGTNLLPTLNSSTEAEKLPLDTEPMENTMRIGCESSVTGCSNPKPVHSEIPAPGKSGLKTHFFGNSRPQGDPTRRRPTNDSGMHDSNKPVKIVTCNIEGAISNKHYLEKLCKENHIICIQEHWL